MKKSSRRTRPAEWKEKPALTVGMDLGDRFSHYCGLNKDGEVVEEGRIPTREAALRRQFEGEPRQRIAMECGTHSPWVSRLLKQLGHQVMVANARKLRAITTKSDQAKSTPKTKPPPRGKSKAPPLDTTSRLIEAAEVRLRRERHFSRELFSRAGQFLPTCLSSAQGPPGSNKPRGASGTRGIAARE
jgi:hypothetical protein